MTHECALSVLFLLMLIIYGALQGTWEEEESSFETGKVIFARSHKIILFKAMVFGVTEFSLVAPNKLLKHPICF